MHEGATQKEPCEELLDGLIGRGTIGSTITPAQTGCGIDDSVSLYVRQSHTAYIQPSCVRLIPSFQIFVM